MRPPPSEKRKEKTQCPPTSRRGELDTHVELLVSHTVVMSALADPASRARRPAETARKEEDEGRIILLIWRVEFFLRCRDVPAAGVVLKSKGCIRVFVTAPAEWESILQTPQG